MKLQIVSDLHIETEERFPSCLDFIEPCADILVLGGDIGRIHKFEQLNFFLTDVCKYFLYVLYVPGNHEYYKEKGFLDKNMDELFSELLKIKSNLPNLYILNNTCVQFENICIIGSTLWSRSFIEIPHYMVRIAGVNTVKYNEMHSKDLNYIKKMIKYCKEQNLKLVVISHYCPSYSAIKSCNTVDKYVSLYTSNLDYLLCKENMVAWIYGHTHRNFDEITKQGTRLVSNQKGKPKDKIVDFSRSKVIEI